MNPARGGGNHPRVNGPDETSDESDSDEDGELLYKPEDDDSHEEDVSEEEDGSDLGDESDVEEVSRPRTMGLIMKVMIATKINNQCMMKKKS